MANLGQTLTGLGKWWGRKPLVLVRATLLGVLLPVSTDPAKDREIFLKLMTMDEEGLYLRKSKNLTQKELYQHSSRTFRDRYMEFNNKGQPIYKKGLSGDEKERLQRHAFFNLSYDEKLKYCDRPEHLENLPSPIWKEVNEHLETNADSFQGLIEELGVKRFGHRPRVGDCFSGGGSIPFEAARLGADVYGSDLNPVAALLTWASLNIAGASDEEIADLRGFQEKVYQKVDQQITEWGIEHNEAGHRADSYLYCMEVKCPECGHKVPLAPSWVIGRGTKTVALLENNNVDGFEFRIKMDASKSDFAEADRNITVRGDYIYCPNCERETLISALRGDRQGAAGGTVSGLRLWQKDEFMPRSDDVFHERLYCVRYVEEYTENGRLRTERYFSAPTKEDLDREAKVIALLKERFSDWQSKGYIPSAIIEEGYNTAQPIRERGWKYWHQLFNPRQLLVNGLFAKIGCNEAEGKQEIALLLLGINKLINWNSALSGWINDGANEKGRDTFYNQALNTLYNYLSRTLLSLQTTWFFNINNSIIRTQIQVKPIDARALSENCDIWITDPPYADAVNYHELTEFFLAWDELLLEKAFPEWHTDSKRVLAVRGTGQKFNNSMVEIYRNLGNNMSGNGIQVVMFTHQDVKVWAELAMILWGAGLKVLSAWTISTETATVGLRSGNYVSGTVILTLKKQTSDERIYQDELYEEICCEVESMIDSMRDLNDKDDPDFNDADFILASYAAALKAITNYKDIAGIDIAYWLEQDRDSKEVNPIEVLISKAQGIAYDYLIPEGFDKQIWRDLSKEERFFIRGFELELSNIYRIGDYQELARGFGVTDYTDMFYSTRANEARFKTATEFKMRILGDSGFGSTLTRHLLVALNESIKEESPSFGLTYLKTKYQEENEYWKLKPRMVEILNFVAEQGIERLEHMQHWHETAYYAKVLREALKNDGV